MADRLTDQEVAALTGCRAVHPLNDYPRLAVLMTGQEPIRHIVQAEEVQKLAKEARQLRRDLEALERVHDATSEELQTTRDMFRVCERVLARTTGELAQVKARLAQPGEASISLQHYRQTVETFRRWATRGEYYPRHGAEPGGNQ